MENNCFNSKIRRLLMKDGNFKNNNSEMIEDKDENTAVESYTKNIKLDDTTKIKIIEKNFREIMITLGLDLQDDSLKDSPHRVAKMDVKETFSGLNKDFYVNKNFDRP
jgi:GTP cyclohydrolase IA